ncbi:Hypothetical protein SRAE_1000235800 [Strongyloides ratti]|uniref:F-box domain-containing protein n=1 Tax=Strongyloides ratti TaxID=34506 RepID=A0A090L314_STRRB|nr:Hypothetical protein SRAE_1000235800 [Strongyloides ratti]CEF64102.1 Hypothetical protein SRAE_1000235800 [Strongyloides ratti]
MNDYINQTSIESFETRRQRIANEFYQKVRQAIEENNDNIYINNRIKKITAIETVRNNDEIMNIILRNIPSFKDRLHIQLSCKHFYSLCNNGRSYLPQFEYEKYTKEVLCVKNYNDEFITFLDGTVTFHIPIFNDDILSMLNESKNKVQTFLSLSNALVFSRLPNTYFDFFNGVGSFLNIKVLSLTIEYLNSETIKFFKILSNIKSHTLYLAILNGDRDLNFDLLVSNNDLKISKTIKHMYYQRGRHFLEVVLHLLKSCNIEQLETLEFPHIGKPHNINEENLFLQFLPYVKNIKFNETISKQDYSSQHFKDFFASTTIFKDPKVTLRYQINIRFSDAEFGRYYESLTRNSTRIDNESTRQNIEAGYISITNLCLGNILFYDTNSKLSDEELSAFANDLLKMKNLKTIQTRFLTFSSPNHFTYFCRSLNRNIENIKLEKCSYMSIHHLEEIARNCKYVKNLILEEVTSETITLNSINLLFKNLIGLQINFDSCYDVSKIINDLTKRDEDGVLKVAWSQLHFLNINCAYPKSNERYILQQLAKNTPRKCGQLLIQYLKPSICVKEYVLRIIMQRSTLSCTKFKSSFAKTYLLG